MFSEVICPCGHDCCEQVWYRGFGLLDSKYFWDCQYGCTCHVEEDDPEPWDAYGLTYDDLFGD